MNLYFSVVLRRDSTLPTISWLPLLVSLAVLRAVNNVTGLATHLKWPNDVIIERTPSSRKLAGVLAEATDRAVVLGVGMNVNMPSGLPFSATTYCNLNPHGSWALDGCRAELLAQILWETEQLCDPAPHSSNEGMTAYLKACSTLGKAVHVTLSDGGDIEGLAVAIAADGALCVQKPDSSIIEIRAGDVVHLR